MASQEISSLAQLGARVAGARGAVGLTQGALGDSVGHERTMIAKIESGTWKVSATELVRSSRGLIDPSIDSSLSHRRRSSS